MQLRKYLASTHYEEKIVSSLTTKWMMTQDCHYLPLRRIMLLL